MVIWKRPRAALHLSSLMTVQNPLLANKLRTVGQSEEDVSVCEDAVKKVREILKSKYVMNYRKQYENSSVFVAFLRREEIKTSHRTQLLL